MGCGPSKFELDKDHHPFKPRLLRNNNDKKIECPAPIVKDEIECQEEDKIDGVTRNNDDDRNKEEDSKNGCQQENDKKIGSQKPFEKKNVAEKDEEEEEEEEEDVSHGSDERLLAFSLGSPSFRVYCDDRVDSTHEKREDETKVQPIAETDSTHSIHDYEKREEVTLKETKVLLTETEPRRRGRRRRRRRITNVFQKGIDGTHSTHEKRKEEMKVQPIAETDSTHSIHEKRAEEKLKETKVLLTETELETETRRRGRRKRTIKNVFQRGRSTGKKTILTAENNPYKAIKFGLSEK